MTVLSIARNVALSVGLDAPTLVAGSSSREASELLRFITETCTEIARRVQWGDLTRTVEFEGDGTPLRHALPDGFDRLTDGVCVVGANGPVRPLTQAEWAGLPLREGVPSYFLLQDQTIQLFPYLAMFQQVAVTFQSGLFVDGTADHFSDDEQSPVFDERIVEIGTIARWRRQKGQPYQDHEAEYEAMLVQRAANDDRGRF